MLRAKAPAFALALLLAAITAVYANHFHNGFHFDDDAHTIENNAAIRELKNIPRFFTDATTFSSLPSNQSYRPIVSTLLALSYSFGGGLKLFWFHLSIIGLFVGNSSRHPVTNSKLLLRSRVHLPKTPSNGFASG